MCAMHIKANGFRQQVRDMSSLHEIHALLMMQSGYIKATGPSKFRKKQIFLDIFGEFFMIIKILNIWKL